MYSIILDGVSVFSVENTAPAKIEKVKVLAGDDWYEPVDGQIRGLDIKSEAA